MSNGKGDRNRSNPRTFRSGWDNIDWENKRHEDRVGTFRAIAAWCKPRLSKVLLWIREAYKKGLAKVWPDK